MIVRLSLGWPVALILIDDTGLALTITPIVSIVLSWGLSFISPMVVKEKPTVEIWVLSVVGSTVDVLSKTML